MVYNLIPVNRMPNINIKEIMKLEKSSFRTHVLKINSDRDY